MDLLSVPRRLRSFGDRRKVTWLFADVQSQFNELQRRRKLAGTQESSLPDSIEWAPTLDAAFTRATQEDKPVLLLPYVRENGNPAGEP